MLFLIPYYLYAILLLWIYGLMPFIFLKQNPPRNPFSPLITGFAVLGTLSQLFWIGGPINSLCFIVTIIGAAITIYLNKKTFAEESHRIFIWFGSRKKTEHILISIFTLVIIYQSALLTKINDMGMYYLQTLQWMSNYGLIKGLANLHPALGLGSAWHSLTALLNPASMGMTNMWQLSGIILLTFIFFNWYEWTNSKSVFLKVVFLLSLPLSFLYLTAPSPDLPLLLLSSILFYWVWFEPDKIHPVILLLLCVFLFACKVPAFVPVGLAIYLFFTERDGFKKKLVYLLLGAGLLSLIFYKNYMLSGYLLYPFNQPDVIHVTWKVPADWNEAYRKGIVSWGFNDQMDVRNFQQYRQQSSNRLLTWLWRPGYKGLMNKILFANFLFGLILLVREVFRKQKKFAASSLILLTLLLFISSIEWYMLSQYRLMLPTQLILAGLNASMVFSLLRPETRINFRFIADPKYVLHSGTFLFLIMAFVPFSILSEKSRNKSITQSKGFNSEYLIRPNTGLGNEPTDSIKAGDLYIHFYPNRAYCWDCPLPCQSASQRNVVYTNFGYKITPMGSKVEDGFYLKRDGE